LIKFRVRDPNVAEALKMVGGVIEKSGNREAAAKLDELNKRLAERDNEVVVKGLWERILALIPDIAKLGDVALKIGEFIGKLT
jgi:hypothetical protein